MSVLRRFLPLWMTPLSFTMGINVFSLNITSAAPYYCRRQIYLRQKMLGQVLVASLAISTHVAIAKNGQYGPCFVFLSIIALANNYCSFPGNILCSMVSSLSFPPSLTIGTRDKQCSGGNDRWWVKRKWRIGVSLACDAMILFQCLHFFCYIY